MSAIFLPVSGQPPPRVTLSPSITETTAVAYAVVVARAQACAGAPVRRGVDGLGCSGASDTPEMNVVVGGQHLVLT